MDSAVVADKSVLHKLWERLNALAGIGFMSLASQGINSANNLITGIIMGRLCPKEEYGLYALGFSLVMLITDFQSTVISTPYMIYSPRLYGEDKRRYAGSTLVHQLAFSSITLFILLCGLGAVYSGMAQQSFMPVLEILVIVIVFVMMKEFIRQMCFAALNVKAALLLDAIVAVAQICCLSVLAYYGALSARRSFIVIGIVCAVTSTVWLLANRYMFVVKLKLILPDLRQKWTLVKWITASQLLWIATMGLYPWILAAFQGVRANAVWAAAQSVMMIGNLISVAAQNLVGPRLVHVLAEAGVSDMRRVIFKSALLMVFIMSVLSIFFIVFGNALVVFVYGSSYEGYGSIVSVLALNLVVSSATYPFSRGLFALERADLDFLVNLAVVITLFLGIWLVRTFGLLGAACGLLAANSLSALLRGVVFNRIALTAPADLGTRTT
jgi:O-antigen/teichoic acid export membrane protein